MKLNLQSRDKTIDKIHRARLHVNIWLYIHALTAWWLIMHFICNRYSHITGIIDISLFCNQFLQLWRKMQTHSQFSIMTVKQRAREGERVSEATVAKGFAYWEYVFCLLKSWLTQTDLRSYVWIVCVDSGENILMISDVHPVHDLSVNPAPVCWKTCCCPIRTFLLSNGLLMFSYWGRTSHVSF